MRSLSTAELDRMPPITSGGRFKQWVHTTVSTPEIAMVANFSSIYDNDDPVHRLTTLVFGESVQGNVCAHPGDACRVAPGRSAIQIGASSIVPTKTGFELIVFEPSRGLTAELALEARSATSALYNMRFGAEDVLHWSVMPRLVANGTIVHGGRMYQVVDAPAYRDRNWGAVRFGEVAWDWGYVLADDLANPLGVVFARLMDSRRTRLIQQEVLVWSGTSLLASFRSREVAFAADGTARGPFPMLPSPLALCRPGHASDVPERLAITASSPGRGAIEVAFEPAATARIVVPNDAGVGTTAIYESLGRVQVRGHADGRKIELEGRGFLESVHA